VPWLDVINRTTTYYPPPAGYVYVGFLKEEEEGPMRSLLDDVGFIKTEIAKLKTKIAQAGGGSSAPLPAGTITEADFEPILECLDFYDAAIKAAEVETTGLSMPVDEPDEKEKKRLAPKQRKK
jgi:hypothetical protein